MSQYRSKQLINATQFVYKDEMEEHRIAKILGLSRNNGSLLWEGNFVNLGWRIVKFGDYIIHTGTRDVPCDKSEFERRYEKRVISGIKGQRNNARRKRCFMPNKTRH